MASKKILIIDDDEEMCEELKDVLENEGHSVDYVNDGLKGEVFIERGGHDVILLDLKMPELDGYHVLEYARRKFPDMKIIVFTGSPVSARILREEEGEEHPITDQNRDSVLALADAVINKPCMIERVIAAIRELK